MATYKRVLAVVQARVREHIVKGAKQNPSNKVKGASSGYQYFMADKAANSNDETFELKKAADAWKLSDAATKAPFLEKAAADKARAVAEKVGWKAEYSSDFADGGTLKLTQRGLDTLTRKVSDEAVRGFFEVMAEEVAKGEKVSVSGHGSFAKDKDGSIVFSLPAPSKAKAE